MSLAPDSFNIDNVLLFQGKELFRALNHPLRQKIILMIHSHGRMTVTQLFTKMGLEQSVTSNHLALLRSQKLLLAEKQQKFVFYSLNYGRLKKVQESVANYLGKLAESRN
jgi:DNA-binding transcriptional ArsR family regulator